MCPPLVSSYQSARARRGEDRQASVSRRHQEARRFLLLNPGSVWWLYDRRRKSKKKKKLSCRPYGPFPQAWGAPTREE